MENIYKHTKQKNCQVHLLRIEKIGNNLLKIYYCETHKVEICRCGSEWGKH